MILTQGTTRALGSFLVVVGFWQVTTPGKLPGNRQSYSNQNYGFTLQYPENFTHCAAGLAYCDFTSQPYIPVCDHNVVNCFVYAGREYEGTNFEGAALSVNVLRDKRSEQECNKIDVGPQQIKVKTINGTRFSYAMAGGVGLGHFGGGQKYRTLYDKVCFELAANISETSFANFDPGTIKKFDSTKLEKDFDAIINSFKFTGPVADGPAWRVYMNTEVGGTFEYPDGVTVVKSVEYSNERFYSNAITDSTYFADHGLNYFVDAKSNLGGIGAVDFWLKLQGYPDLSKAAEIRHSKLFAEYRAGDYRYIFGNGTLYILGASDQQHHVVAPPNNTVFRHFVNSFKPD
jgi:hypothetical protein